MNILKIGDFRPLLHKNGLNLGILRPYFLKKWHKITNFQNFQKSLLNFGTLYDVVMWYKFQLIWTKIECADTFGVRYLKMSILSVFYKRSCQNRELQNAIIFEQKLILTFRKKPLLPHGDLSNKPNMNFLTRTPPIALMFFQHLLIKRSANRTLISA